jgi:hypothetical protein
MPKDIKVSGEFVLFGGEMAERNSLYLEWVDYGDGIYDLHIGIKGEDRLFGQSAWCGISGLTKLQHLIEMVQQASGIQEIRRTTDFDWELR